MALEIERRFLVSGDQWRRHVQGAREIRQGYLASGNEGLTLRVRLARPPVGSMEAFLTLKLPAALDAGMAPPPGQALTRQEYEYPIPALDAEALLERSDHSLSKTRFGLDLPGGDWVLDVFEDPNAPLVVAEVELERADQAVAIPAWCATEITGRRELSNASLARRPLALWSAAERQALLSGV
ncbi:CYTH domain-containing protein [Synechococcus sp. CS-1332]|uniref:CYTH domain-containing protein n=1 Tax=Synechococcus sp. CS-1332 TaxID=2847972 RepID=UPI00223BF097|nr:CYTH domain-containing protein [Synechococcus sp. CS-1332]MCT0206307.1 CYTH domain-containing protein [Synechococcus sp. CS-1332]